MDRESLVRMIVALTVLVTVNGSIVCGQWIQQNSGTQTTLTDVAALTSLTALAVGRDGSILRTTDAGSTWLEVPLLPLFFHPWNALSFSDSMRGCVVGDYGRVATTMDGGKNWDWHGTPDGRTCLSTLFVWAGNIYVGADSGWIYHSQDTGKTWTSEKISMWPIRSLFAWRGTYVMGLPLYALTPYSLCSRVEFPPTSWSETILLPFMGLGAEAFRGQFCGGGGAGFIVGVQGDFRASPAIVRKLMSDTVWRSISTGLLGDGTLFGVSAPSSNTIYVCGDHGMLFKSTNGGDAWFAPKVPTSQRLRAMSFLNDEQGFAVGDSGVILYTSNGGTTSIGEREDNSPDDYTLYQNYPNPFNPATTITYRVPKLSMVRLTVYDMLGRYIAELVKEVKQPGTYSVHFEAAGLASGVYFYRLEAGSFAQTRRSMLVR